MIIRQANSVNVFDTRISTPRGLRRSSPAHRNCPALISIRNSQPRSTALCNVSCLLLLLKNSGAGMVSQTPTYNGNGQWLIGLFYDGASNNYYWLGPNGSNVTVSCWKKQQSLSARKLFELGRWIPASRLWNCGSPFKGKMAECERFDNTRTICLPGHLM